jgi:NADPH:quinone reductase-like Zn-dependent oxidoreductase
MTESVEVKMASGTRTETKLMKAIIRSRFGPPEVLQLKDVEKPAPNEIRGVLVKIYAASVNPADRYDMSPPLLLRLFLPLFKLNMGVLKPKDPGLGSDAAGRVEAVTDAVSQLKPGDDVFGSCKGSYAEYAVAREDRLVVKPPNCSFEEAAAVPIAGITALQALRDHGHIQPLHKVLVNGAGGGVGTYAVQIAKSYGAEVTAVTNADNLDMVRSLGADHVIDYTKDDFTKNGQRYDLICDIAATHSISDYKRALNPNGTCILVGFRDKVILRLLYFLLLRRLLSGGGKKFRFFIAKINQKDLNILKDLLETKKVRSVIDRPYTLNELGEAMHHLEQGHARGKIIITVGSETKANIPSTKRWS